MGGGREEGVKVDTFSGFASGSVFCAGGMVIGGRGVIALEI